MAHTDWSVLRELSLGDLNLEDAEVDAAQYEVRPSSLALHRCNACQGQQEQADADVQVTATSDSKPKRCKHLSYPIAWLDLEMTGLNVESDTILQAAMIVTDGLLRFQVEGPDIAIHQTDAVLDNMNDWCTSHHAASGLVQRCQASTISMAEAEQQLLAFIQPYTRPGRCPLGGNSVHMDVAFLRKHMPELLAHFHHRIVDVSSISELARRWFPDEHAKAPKKSQSHLAMTDIQESIAELKYYRSTIFKKRL